MFLVDEEGIFLVEVAISVVTLIGTAVVLNISLVNSLFD